MMGAVNISIIIPARNEQRLIRQTLQHVLAACHQLSQAHSQPKTWEILLIDNGSTDETPVIAASLAGEGVRLISYDVAGAARARNAGRKHSNGQILVFVDADTMIPPQSLLRIANHCEQSELVAGITSLGTLDGGIRAKVWWSFWNLVRHLPLPKAKAMPALMFCTTQTFDRFGPFDENVAIGEEWPILSGLYRTSRQSLIYDRSIVARSSSRRMHGVPFGYTRCFLKYVWAILHQAGRIHYTDEIR